MSVGYAICHTSPSGVRKWITHEVAKSFIGSNRIDDENVFVGFTEMKDASLSLAYYLTERYKGAPLYDRDPLFAPRERQRIMNEVVRKHKITLHGNEYGVRLVSLDYISNKILNDNSSANCYIYDGKGLDLFDYVMN